MASFQLSLRRRKNESVGNPKRQRKKRIQSDSDCRLLHLPCKTCQSTERDNDGVSVALKEDPTLISKRSTRTSMPQYFYAAVPNNIIPSSKSPTQYFLKTRITQPLSGGARSPNTPLCIKTFPTLTYPPSRIFIKKRRLSIFHCPLLVLSV